MCYTFRNTRSNPLFSNQNSGHHHLVFLSMNSFASIKDPWISSALEAAAELAETSLGTEDIQIVRQSQEITGSFGAYIPLILEEGAIHVGVIASQENCIALTRMLLWMEPDEEDPSPSDVADSIGEIANILSGGIQRRMVKDYPFSHIGLPVFVDSHVAAPENMSAHVILLQIADVLVELAILRPIQAKPEFSF